MTVHIAEIELKRMKEAKKDTARLYLIAALMRGAKDPLANSPLQFRLENFLFMLMGSYESINEIGGILGNVNAIEIARLSADKKLFEIARKLLTVDDFYKVYQILIIGDSSEKIQ